MFPREFEHEGEHQIAPMPIATWYETHLRSKREDRSPSPTALVTFEEVWARNGPKTLLIGGPFFNVARAKELLARARRLPAFVDVDLLDGDRSTQEYLKTIYRYREDEWHWVNVHTPGILTRFQGVWILVDGNHRYARAKRLGHKYFLAYIITEEEALSTQKLDDSTQEQIL